MYNQLCQVFVNRKTSKKIHYFFNSESKTHRSLRLLKRKIHKQNFGLFLHLTYNDDHLASAGTRDVRIFFNNLKQTMRNKRTFWLNKNNTRLANRYAILLKLFKYAWKTEFDSEGKRDFNPHFHILIKSDLWLNKSRIEKLWGKGFVKLQKITSQKGSQKYVSKYFSKHPELAEHYANFPRMWSSSINIKSVKSEFRYFGLEYLYNILYEQLYSKNLDNFLNTKNQKQQLAIRVVLSVKLFMLFKRDYYQQSENLKSIKMDYEMLDAIHKSKKVQADFKITSNLIQKYLNAKKI